MGGSEQTTGPQSRNDAVSVFLKALYEMVDEIVGELDPPTEYRTAEEQRAWIRGVLDAQHALRGALHVE